MQFLKIHTPKVPQLRPWPSATVPWASGRPLPQVYETTRPQRCWVHKTANVLDKYTGREYDPETGLYYYRARYYDPRLGRFISQDPIGLAFDDGSDDPESYDFPRPKRKPVSAEYATLAMTRLRRVLDACGVKDVESLTTDTVNAVLDRLQEEGGIATAQTRHHHESIVRTFGKWLVVSERQERDPFRRLKLTFVGEADTVHDRTAFTPEQLQKIVDAARSGPPRRGLTGEQRAMLYVTAAYSGLRARECGAVRKQDFTPGMTHVVVAGIFTKNGKEAMQPVPSFLRLLLTTYVANLTAEDFLFPGGWELVDGKWEPTGWVRAKSAGKLLRFDAAKVGIIIGRKGRDQNGGVLDFHSLRHFYGTVCDQAGISDGLRRKLHRASTQQLLDRYTHRELAELTAAVEELPAISWAS